MPLPLPNLDDRRWAEMVDEARALIPVYAPEWTDHNASDPGISLLELFAWLAEMDIYGLNRITAALRLKFLALAGFTPAGPQPARTVLRFELPLGGASVALPAGLEAEGVDPFGEVTTFRLSYPVNVDAAAIAALQWGDGSRIVDLTTRWRHGDLLKPFGPDPKPGAAFYLGFDRSFPQGEDVSLHFTFDGDRAGISERQRLIREIVSQAAECLPPGQGVCADGTDAGDSDDSGETNSEIARLRHHSARVAWEYAAPGGDWVSIAGVIDQTRAFTLCGTVTLRLPGPMESRVLGAVEQALYYLRCRLLSGALDAAPTLTDVSLNGVVAEQAASLMTTMPILKGATITGDPPDPGEFTGIMLALASDGSISSLEFQPDSEFQFRLLEYTAPATIPGSLSIEAAFVGTGTGRPEQQVSLAESAVLAEAVRVFGLEGPMSGSPTWREWTLRPDFDASGRADAHFTLDASAGAVHFGDGEHGRVPPSGALLFAAGSATRAEQGNLPAGSVQVISDSIENGARVDDLPAVLDRVSVSQPLAASGGFAAETIDQASGRALDRMKQQDRAVTLADYETLALQTPGTRIARVAAFANLHPALPCITAPGNVTVVALPYLPLGRPLPSAGLLNAVDTFLRPRRVVGTRARVVAPVYTEVIVRAKVKALPNVSRAALAQRVIEAIDGFFDPLLGGPDGIGWPFGRDVYRSEVMAVIDGTPGTDNVLSLDLVSGGVAQCGNLCIGRLGLVDAGQHEIEVV